MATQALDRPSPKTKSTIKVIDADTHLTEPHDMWIKRAPASIRDRVPQVKMLDGTRSWVIDGDKSIGTGAHPNSSILKEGGKVRDLDTFLALQFEDVHAGSSDVKERLKVMDEAGIYAQIVYPNILGFGGQAAAQGRSRPQPRVRQDLQRRDGRAAGRLGRPAVPDGAAALVGREEVGRGDRALRPRWACAGSTSIPTPHFQVDADGNQIPDLGHEHWYPLWEVCEDRNLPVNFHIGARPRPRSTGWVSRAGRRCRATSSRASRARCWFFNNGKTVSNLIYSGMLDRFKKIKFVSVESGTRLGAVPDGGARLPAGGDRRHAQLRQEAVRVFQEQLLRLLLVREKGRVGHAAQGRRRQLPVRNRLPAPRPAFIRSTTWKSGCPS